MSKASVYGAKLADAIIGVRDETTAQDLVTNIMHWLRREGFYPEDVVEAAMAAFDAEDGDGDDLANDPGYDTLTRQLDTDRICIDFRAVVENFAGGHRDEAWRRAFCRDLDQGQVMRRLLADDLLELLDAAVYDTMLGFGYTDPPQQETEVMAP
jgi:hypothetical protein